MSDILDSAESTPIIRDWMPLEISNAKSVLTEGIGGKKHRAIRLSGQFQYANRANQNGRVYPREVLREAVQAMESDLAERKVMGEFDHPPDAKIHLDRVSHLITKLWMEGDVCYGELEILPKTPMGAVLQGLIESNVKVGISSRGVGDMETKFEGSKEIHQVMPGYQLVTFDVVAEPSVQDSYLSVMESRNRMLNSSRKGRNYHERQIIKEIRGILR